MKKVKEFKPRQYRDKYTHYLGIDAILYDYDVHHLDHNRINDSIENLVAIPKKLHQQYHFYVGYVENLKYHFERGQYYPFEKRDKRSEVRAYEKILADIRKAIMSYKKEQDKYAKKVNTKEIFFKIFKIL